MKAWFSVRSIAIIAMVATMGFLIYSANGLAQTPRWTNMTEEFANQQLTKSIADADQKCKEKGGEGFVVGAGCIPFYDQFKYPEQLWYIVPIENPMYLLAHAAELLSLLAAFFLAIAAALLFVGPLVMRGQTLN